MKQSSKPPHADEMVMRRRDVEMMGMLLDEWRYMSCIAHFGTGDDWATLYDIESREEGKGHATGLLTTAKHVYEQEGKVVKGSIALNERMRTIYQELGIPEITHTDDE